MADTSKDRSQRLQEGSAPADLALLLHEACVCYNLLHERREGGAR